MFLLFLSEKVLWIKNLL